MTDFLLFNYFNIFADNFSIKILFYIEKIVQVKKCIHL